MAGASTQKLSRAPLAKGGNRNLHSAVSNQPKKTDFPIDRIFIPKLISWVLPSLCSPPSSGGVRGGRDFQQLCRAGELTSAQQPENLYPSSPPLTKGRNRMRRSAFGFAISILSSHFPSFVRRGEGRSRLPEAVRGAHVRKQRSNREPLPLPASLWGLLLFSLRVI